MVRHTNEDAPSEAEYRTLMNATTDLTYPYNLEARWILTVAGRLGLRAGEICHMRVEWIDWDRETINIPRHERCRFGADGGVCGYCHRRAEAEARNNDDLSLEEALAGRWHPKTDAAARAVPFGFRDDIRGHVEAFWSDRDKFPLSRSGVNRRVNRVLDAAGWPTNSVYPHALRGCAATWHAYRGVPAVALQAMFGWEELATARKYIRLSGGQTADALAVAHQD